MPNEAKNHAPAAIVIGAAMIAAGLYFGLRARPEAVVAPAPVPLSSVAPRAMVPPPPPPPAADAAAATKEVAAVIASKRPELAKACASLLTPPSKEPKRVDLNITFDASGKEIVRGVTEPRGRSTPGLGNCVTDALPPLTVTPQGVTVRVEVPVELP